MIKNESLKNSKEMLFSKFKKLILTKEEVAEILGISQSTLNRRIKEGSELPSYKKIGGKYFFPIEAIALYECNLTYE